MVASAPFAPFALSARRIRANRRNGRKSTGPKTAAGKAVSSRNATGLKTPKGKAVSSRNATGHGIFCKDLVLPGEDGRMLQMLQMLRTSLSLYENRLESVVSGSHAFLDTVLTGFYAPLLTMDSRLSDPA